MYVAVFQRGNFGEHVIAGIQKYGKKVKISKVFSVPSNIAQLIDLPERYINVDFKADLIFDYLYHQDLTEFLVKLANEKGIPIIVPNRKVKNAYTPVTCCSLKPNKVLKGLTKEFGYPEFKVKVKDNEITDIKVLRGAPCGATWIAAEKIKGLQVEQASKKIALEVQYLCKAPTGYDFLRSKKSLLHIAGEVHSKALGKALSYRKV
jgi:hypothetical protein